ncbi:hypothetical protein HMPREF9630_00574 [Peptoanaerobacter stomatis]|uniref:Uncharacterized protein n=1 Tax=Peptoanaerobacter stomatis TaxID=796937 RepID=V9HVC1_9FIRM|nr:hypothetical protein [Peptoanaerobacter stomatis]EHL17407.1 hypothetical protein HMPREF9630_00574 [Peptoanaerobacter stomatis]
MNKELIKKAVQDKIYSLYSDIDKNKYLAWKNPHLKEKLENQNEKIELQIQKYEQLLNDAVKEFEENE